VGRWQQAGVSQQETQLTKLEKSNLQLLQVNQRHLYFGRKLKNQNHKKS